MPVTAITSIEEWKSSVTTDNSGLVAVDFYADYCGPCRMAAPKFEQMSNEPTLSHVKFVKVDTQKTELESISEEYDVHAIPTFVILQNGKMIHKTVGANLDQVKRALLEAGRA